MLKASAAAIELAPPVGEPMYGYIARTEPSVGIHDPLFARAIVFDDGNSRAAIISCDLLALEVETAAEIRRRIELSLGIPASSVIICCTHTHSGPITLISEKLSRIWLELLKDKIVKAVQQALSSLKPAVLRHASTVVGEIGFNREYFWARNGGKEAEDYPIDESLNVLAVDSTDGGAIATVVNYAVHGVVLGPQNLEYSADFPGATCKHLAELRGGEGIYIQGACGEIDPTIQRDRGWGTGTFDDVEQYASRLAHAAIEALKDSTIEIAGDIQSSARIVNIPLDEPPSDEEIQQISDEANEYLDKEGELNQQIGSALLEWTKRIRYLKQINQIPSAWPVEITAIKIGQLCIVGLPFETFSAIGQGIKNRISPLIGWFAGYANGYLGYLPTKWAKDLGGYGGKTACRYGFGPLIIPPGYGADDFIVNETVKLAKESFI